MPETLTAFAKIRDEVEAERPYTPPYFNRLGFLQLDLRAQWIKRTAEDLRKLLRYGRS